MSYAVNLYKMLCSYHLKLQQPWNYPWVADVEVTNACQLNCVFCARENVRERGVGFMDRETFYNVVNEDNRRLLRHTRLFMHGESLLHPLIVEFVEQASKIAKTVGFTTNGVALTPLLSEKLLKAGLTTICFSFEGTRWEVYEKLRRGASYEKVLHNILDFIALRDMINPQCFISMAIIDTPETHPDLQQFSYDWRMKGINAVSILKLHDWGGIHHWNVGEAQWKNEVCLWPWFGLGVYWNGDVSPCCLYERKIALGNVNTQSVEDIWRSREYQDFRQAHLHNRIGLDICRTCTLAKSTFSATPYLQNGNPSIPNLMRSVGSLISYGVKRS